MVRYETDEGVAYGSDPGSGIFLSIEMGEDIYFDLHTGRAPIHFPRLTQPHDPATNSAFQAAAVWASASQPSPWRPT